jgi:hypothetical protein
MRRRRGPVVKVEPEECCRRRVRVSSQPDGAASDVSWRRQMEQPVSALKDGIARLLLQKSCRRRPSFSRRRCRAFFRRWRLVVVLRCRVVARHRRGRRDGASRAVLPAILLGTVRRPSRPGTHLRRFARSRQGDKSDMYRSTELNKGGKISGVKVTLDIGIVFSFCRPDVCVARGCGLLRSSLVQPMA